jgi:sugar O-acyltransferase (sialic acid O-acetyltransferase NeuD family)
MKKIAIIGAGGFGREVKMLIDQINFKNKVYEFIGFFDDGVEKNTMINGCPVLGSIEDINKVEYPLSISMAIGNPLTKISILEKINNKKISFETLIHPNALIGEYVEIGKGSIICAGNILTCNIEIKNFVTINLMCSVGHDTVLENFVSIMPGVNVSGEVVLEEGVYIGTGAKIINQVKVGKYSIIGSGAVVSKSIPENCTAVGVPAKTIKFNS